MNTIMVIHPYKYRGQWVFDDDSRGLVREALIAGTDVLLDVVAKDIPYAALGMTVLFSPEPFPGSDITLTYMGPQGTGYSFWCPEHRLYAWLCPSMLKYFKEPPDAIYIKAKEMPRGV